MVEHELSSHLQAYLAHPVWARRITVLIGSPLRQTDLVRARAQSAIACFIHTARHQDECNTAVSQTEGDCGLKVVTILPPPSGSAHHPQCLGCEGLRSRL